MQIKEMFKKDINRDIKGVIKVGQMDDENIHQELNEYIVTNELLKHFREFFESYKKGIGNYTDDMGVWISGFFGSGKSHFLKILSYILENKEVNGKKAVDFFKSGRISDPMIIADMLLSSQISTDVILFNIDAKSSTSDYDENAILDVFLKVFNEFQGFSSSYPFLADLERKLSHDGIYDNFKIEFKKTNSKDWETQREKFYFIQDDIVSSLNSIGYMSEESARNWAENADDNYKVSIEDFSKLIQEYLESKGNDHHIVFLVDEIGQYIGENSKLMLNLQTLTEELGINCGGKAWIVVTSQEAIDSLVDLKGKDFSKIQGRFKTRLSLSSSNVDEVIRKRILGKNGTAIETLVSLYEGKEAIIKNLIHFEDSAEMKRYIDAEDFAEVYPFIPYQFNLLSHVLTAIREHGASGQHLSEGERSMLALFQESAIDFMNESEGSLVPFNLFYNALDQFIESRHSSVINKSLQNDNLDSYDSEVLKALFMIKYVKEIKSNLENLTTLLVDNIDVDRVILKKKIEKSLQNLENETLIQKNGDIYTFLTNEEQDINEAIKKENVEIGEIQNKVSDAIFEEIFSDKKYRYSNRYNFDFNKAVDDKYRGHRQNDIGINVITSYFDLSDSFIISQSQLTPEADYERESRILQLKSENNEIIINIRDSQNFLDEIEGYLKIEKYLNKNSSTLSSNYKSILIAKREEISDKKNRVNVFLQEALEDGDIYINGEKVGIDKKNPNSRINDALKNLVNKVYYKLDYMKDEPNDAKIKDTLIHPNKFTESKSNVAIDDLMNYIKTSCSNHSKISFKTILERFKKAPYGFVDDDMRWIIATLFARNSIYLIKNSEQISLSQYSADEVLRFLKDKKYKEKILIDMKVRPNEKHVRSVKNILKEFFDISTPKEDNDLLRDQFLNEMDNYDKFEIILSEYNIEKRYPGKATIKKAKELFKDIKRTKTTLEFYQYVFDVEDELLDLYNQIDSVMTFFNGRQKDIFKESCEIIDTFENNKYLISSQELIHNIDSIREIIEMDSPYSNIHILPELNKFFKEGFSEIVKEEKLDVLNYVHHDKELVLSQLHSSKLKENFETKVNSEFDNIETAINNTEDIPKIQSFKNVSENKREELLNQINEFIRKDDGPHAPSGPVIRPKIVNIKEVLDTNTISIKKEEDIEKFISSLKNKLKEKLEGLDEKGSIDLRF